MTSPPSLGTSPSRPAASVRVGDDIQGATVTAIESGLVRFQFDGREIVVRLR